MTTWGVGHAFVSVMAVMIMVLVSWLIGERLLRRHIPEGSGSTYSLSYTLMSIGIGLGVLIMLAVLLAASHLLKPGLMWAGLLVMGFAPVRVWWVVDTVGRALAAWSRRILHGSRSVKMLVILLITETLSMLLLGLTPVIGWDASVYHLTVPLRFLEAGGWVELPTIGHSYLNLNVDMLFLWALVLHGEQAAHLVTVVLGVLAGASVYALAWHILPRRYALLAMGMFLLVPVVWDGSTDLFIDLGMTFFLLTSLLALLLPRRAGIQAPLVISAFMFGLAIGSKLMAILFIPVIGWSAFVRIRRYGAPSIPCWALAALLLVVSGCIWSLRTFVLTGNPIYPIGNTFFGLPAPPLVQDGLQVFTSLSLPWRVLLAPWQQAAGYYSSSAIWEGGWGPFVLAFAPLLFLFGLRSWLRDWIYPLLVSSLLYLILTPYPRYGLPLLALWSIYAACGIQGCHRQYPHLFRVSVAATLLSGSLFCVLFSAKALQRSPVVVGIQSVQDYLLHRDSIYPVAAWANKNRASGGAVLLIGERSLRFHSPVYVMMSFSPFFTDVFTLKDPAFLYAKMERMGVTDIVVSNSYLDTNLSMVRPMLLAFLHRYGEKRYKVGDYSVYRLIARTMRKLSHNG